MKIIKYLLVLIFLCNANAAFARCEPTNFTEEMLIQTLVKSGIPQSTIEKIIKARADFINYKCLIQEPRAIINIKIRPANSYIIEANAIYLDVYSGNTHMDLLKFKDMQCADGSILPDISDYPYLKKTVISQLKTLEGRYIRLNAAGKNYKEELDTVKQYISILTKPIDFYIELLPQASPTFSEYLSVHGVTARGQEFWDCNTPELLIKNYPEFEKEIIEFSKKSH